MTMNWSTFFLEIINFLILMWILKRFLYHPVMNALEKRTASIHQTQTEASAKMADAQALESRFQQRLSDWEAEKQQLQASWMQSLQQKRTEQLQALQSELDAEREKNAVVSRQEQAEIEKSAQLLAHKQGALFASKLLSGIASPEVESRLCELLLQKIELLTTEELTALQAACQQARTEVIVSSAFPLSTSQEQAIKQKITTLCGQTIPLSFQQNSELLAGLRIHIGAWSLRLNLKDELGRFMELANDNSLISTVAEKNDD